MADVEIVKRDVASIALIPALPAFLFVVKLWIKSLIGMAPQIFLVVQQLGVKIDNGEKLEEDVYQRACSRT